MTTEFAASNGHRIVRQHDDRLAIFDPRGTIDRGVRASLTAALREYFTAERDAELGRWRDEESPDYVVYPARAGSITILHEPTGRQRYLTGRGEAGIATGQFAHTARRYFAAHPEPAPAWHSAQPGEVWLLDIDGTEEPATIGYSTTPGVRKFYVGSDTFDLTDPGITAGRRLWPEPEESDDE